MQLLATKAAESKVVVGCVFTAEPVWKKEKQLGGFSVEQKSKQDMCPQCPSRGNGFDVKYKEFGFKSISIKFRIS